MFTVTENKFSTNSYIIFKVYNQFEGDGRRYCIALSLTNKTCNLMTYLDKNCLPNFL